MEPVEFAELTRRPDAPLDAYALALAAEFGEVAWRDAGERLDRLGRELADLLSDRPRAPHRESAACRVVLSERHGFTGRASDYTDPGNAMLDAVLERGTGLPITLSIVWVEVARRAGVRLAGVGLVGHFVVGHFGTHPPLLLDPFNGGEMATVDAPAHLVRPWSSHEIAMRLLNNLVRSWLERGDLTRALHAADLRLEVPSDDDVREQYASERAALRARLN